MKYLLFNWEMVDTPNDPSNLSDEEFEELANDKGGFVFNSHEDFESAFNAEFFSIHTHQLRIISK